MNWSVLLFEVTRIKCLDVQRSASIDLNPPKLPVTEIELAEDGEDLCIK